jgi:membrane associated rhomboid family serine protease
LILFPIGPQAEESLGRARFLALFLLSTLGGAVAMAVFAPGGLLIGPSPAIWGLFGMIIVTARAQGGSITGLLIMLGLFIVLGLVVGSPWQAGVGGFLVGAALTVVNRRFGAIRQARQLAMATAGIAVALIVIGFIAITAR